MNWKCKQAQELTLNGYWGVVRECCSYPKSFAFHVTLYAVLSDSSFFWSDLNLLLWWWFSMATAVDTHLATDEMASKAQGSTQSLSTPHPASPARDVEKHWVEGLVALLG